MGRDMVGRDHQVIRIAGVYFHLEIQNRYISVEGQFFKLVGKPRKEVAPYPRHCPMGAIMAKLRGK